jgi:hypothetical protein
MFCFPVTEAHGSLKIGLFNAVSSKQVYPMIRSAKDLSPEQKTAIEGLLGRRVLDDKTVSVRAIEPAGLPDQRKRELAEQLRKYFAEVDANRQNVSEAEAEAIMTQAMRSSRPGYRPRP